MRPYPLLLIGLRLLIDSWRRKNAVFSYTPAAEPTVFQWIDGSMVTQTALVKLSES